MTSYDGIVKSIAYYPNGTTLVYSSYASVCIYDTAKGILIGNELKGHMGIVRSVAVSPDGSRIISGSDDKCIRIWDSQTGTLIGKHLAGHLAEITSIALTPDG